MKNGTTSNNNNKIFLCDRKNLLLLILDIFLFITFSLSFIFSGNKFSKAEKVQSSLMNPKNKEAVNLIQITSGNESIQFSKNNGFWFCTDNADFPENCIPCKNEKVETLFNDLAEVRTLEKIKTGKESLEAFGLDLENGFLINYYTGDDFPCLIFGDSNFSETGRYVKSSDNNQIFLVDKKTFDKYLFTNISSWSDPYFVSRCFGKEYKASDIMKIISLSSSGQKVEQKIDKDNLIELRHGGSSFLLPEENSTPESTLEIQMGDTSSFNYSFYYLSDSKDYHVSVSYENPIAGKNFNYSFKISEWTYKKIFN